MAPTSLGSWGTGTEVGAALLGTRERPTFIADTASTTSALRLTNLYFGLTPLICLIRDPQQCASFNKFCAIIAINGAHKQSRLPVRIAHNEARRIVILDGPRRREAARARHYESVQPLHYSATHPLPTWVPLCCPGESRGNIDRKVIQ